MWSWREDCATAQKTHQRAKQQLKSIYYAIGQASQFQWVWQTCASCFRYAWAGVLHG
jgi:hypothetical protein